MKNHGLDKLLSSEGAKVADRTPLPVQLGKYAGKSLTGIADGFDDVTVTYLRSFAVRHRDREKFRSGQPVVLMMVTAAKTIGTDGPEFLDARLDAFRTAAADGGTFRPGLPDRRVKIDVDANESLRRAIVIGKAGWLEVRVIGDHMFTGAERDLVVFAMGDVAPA